RAMAAAYSTTAPSRSWHTAPPPATDRTTAWAVNAAAARPAPGPTEPSVKLTTERPAGMRRGADAPPPARYPGVIGPQDPRTRPMLTNNISTNESSMRLRRIALDVVVIAACGALAVAVFVAAAALASSGPGVVDRGQTRCVWSSVPQPAGFPENQSPPGP